MNAPEKKESEGISTIPNGFIPNIASAAEKAIPGSGAAVTFILSNFDTIKESLAKAGHFISPEEKQNTAQKASSTNKSTEKNSGSVNFMTSPTNQTTLESTLDSIANTAKSSDVKGGVHSALAIAAQNPEMVSTAANGVAPGSGALILPLLKAYNIPGVKQVMNFVVDKAIDREVDKSTEMVKSALSQVTSGPKLGS